MDAGSWILILIMDLKKTLCLSKVILDPDSGFLDSWISRSLLASAK